MRYYWLKYQKNPDSAEIQQNSSNSNTNISKTLSHSIINNTISWKCVTRPSRCISVNCFNRLYFLLRSAQNYKKYTFLNNSKTITHERNKETRQMTPPSSSTFYDLTVCNIHFRIWKYSKFIFMWSPLWFILVCKISQLLAGSYQFR